MFGAKMTILLFFAAFAIVAAPTVRGTVIYVPDHYATIQGAIDASEAGDTIIVRAGTYVENINFLGKAVTVKSESGTEVTIIDGGNPPDPSKGSVVTFGSGEGPETNLQGFTITNGTGTDLGLFGTNGGGILCIDASPTIRENKIIANTVAFGYGSGIECRYSTALIEDNVISQNTGASVGGGIRCYFSSPTIRNNEITENRAFGVYIGGGGIHGYHSSPLVEGNYIAYNNADVAGGGMMFSHNSNPVITGNVIEGNSCGFWGWYAVPGYGAGIWWGYDSDLVITNNLIVGNVAEGGLYGVPSGAGLYCDEATATITNNTIAFNMAVGTYGGGMGGGFYCWRGASVVAVNNIFWGNVAEDAPEINVASTFMPSTLAISYSAVQGGMDSVQVDPGCTLTVGDGMIRGNPLFVTVPQGNHYLFQPPYQPGISPCVDAGDPDSSMIDGTTSIAGIQDDGVVDMGFHYPLSSPDWVVDVKCNGQDASVVITEGDPVIVTLELAPGGLGGPDYDIWALAMDTIGRKRSCSATLGWQMGWCTEYFTGELYDFTDTIHDAPLPVGTYQAWFGLESKPNGNLNVFSVVAFDTVDFQVVP